MNLNSQKTILVVEDSPTISEMIKVYLENAGFATRTCKSPEVALEILGEDKIDLVLTDIMLESKNALTGYHLLKQIKNSKSLKSIPVIVMTENRSFKRARMTAEHLGAINVMRKPLKMDVLIKDIRGYVRS
jgi:DNA-binding response OmpR family regulator